MAYKYLTRRDHPLAPPSGRLPEHRVVLYDKVGPGPLPCHWGCGRWVVWSHKRTSEGCLVTDHVDGDPTNNHPDNLVVSCQTCNLIRGRDSRFEDGRFIVKNGVRSRALLRTCPTCEVEFWVEVKYTKKRTKSGGERGRYCSMKCVYGRSRQDG